MMEKSTSFLGFLNTKDRVFRRVVLELPFLAAAISFILNLLIRGKGLKGSLHEAAFLFLLVCFIALVEEAFRYRRSR